jgi:hypothetical protein
MTPIAGMVVDIRAGPVAISFGVLEAEFFDLLSTSSDRWSTLRMEGREWRNPKMLHQAWEAATARKRATGMSVSTIVLGRTDLPEPDELEQTWTLWLDPPAKRATFMVGSGMVDVVFEGETWWSNGNGVSRSNVNARWGHGLGWGEDLVRTADYVGRLDLDHVEPGALLGRPVLHARARAVHLPRERGKGLHGLIIGEADRVDLAVDRESGVILRAASWFEGVMYRTVEALDVAFDEQFAADAFTIQPLPGQDWVPPGSPRS